jgi:hypothetical protein
LAEKYGLHGVKIFYFGDCDQKGNQIDVSAFRDIERWCGVPFSLERVGLTLDQALRMGVPENPEKPGQYQWEALTDDQAESLIEIVRQQIDWDAVEDIKAQEEQIEESVKAHLQQFQL